MKSHLLAELGRHDEKDKREASVFDRAAQHAGKPWRDCSLCRRLRAPIRKAGKYSFPQRKDE
jgi:hypothetical protein